jgi:hypothetical protein
MTAVAEDPGTEYTFSNDRSTAPDLLRGLGQMYGSFTTRRLTDDADVERVFLEGGAFQHLDDRPDRVVLAEVVVEP